MGIGNGLRNKLVWAFQSKKKNEGRRYVSSAYMFLFSVALIIAAVIIMVSQFVNWNKVFNISTSILEPDVFEKCIDHSPCKYNPSVCTEIDNFYSICVAKGFYS